MKNTLWLVVLFLLVGYSFTFAADGDLGAANGANGSEASPWLIEDFADFQAFCNDTTKWAEGVYTRLEADIDLDPELPGRVVYDNAPIAPDTDNTNSEYDGTDYEGCFDGNNHTISNLSVDGIDYCGLFGAKSSGSIISNLGIENPDISSLRDYVGGLCGVSYGGEIFNCYSNGSVSGNNYVGGLCGDDDSGEISFCTTSGIVIGNEKVGGLAGACNRITNCYTTGSVSGNDQVGGLAGYLCRGIVRNSYSSGTITGTGVYPSCIGGLVGENVYAVIISCYFTGEVSGVSCGGILGLNIDNGMVSNCYSAGKVTGKYVGGIASGAVMHCIIKNCYSNSILEGEEGTYGICNLAADNYPYFPVVLDCVWNTDFASSAFDIDNLQKYYGWGFEHLLRVSGKTTAEMQMISTYTDMGWDFKRENNGTNHFWEMPDEGFPALNIAPLRQFEGSGKDKDPYLIYDVEDLFGINRYVLDGDGVISWEPYTGLLCRYIYHFKLMNDLDLSGYTFNNYIVQSFRGKFYGNFHVIKNIKIEGVDDCGFFSSINPIGYFVYKEKLEIWCLGLENVDISGKDFVGGFIGIAEMCDIFSSYVTGAVEATGDYVGGVAGVMNNDAQVEECYSLADVSGNSYVGGLCGYMDGGYEESSDICSCYSVGLVEGESNAGPVYGAKVDSDVDSCFWDIETSGISDPEEGLEDTDGAVGLPTAEMQIKSTYTDTRRWCFIDRDTNPRIVGWRMPYASPGYPILSWQKDIPGDIAGGYGVDMADAAAVADRWLDSYTMTDLQRMAEYWLAGK